MGMNFPFGSARRSGACGCGSSSPPPPYTIDGAPFFSPDEPPLAAEPVAQAPSPAPGDPIPARFHIVRTFALGPLVAAEIVWPDARNYDGRKVAVYRATLADLANAKTLDPHFAEQRGALVPIARFEPTVQGWNLATELVIREATP